MTSRGPFQPKTFYDSMNRDKTPHLSRLVTVIELETGIMEGLKSNLENL